MSTTKTFLCLLMYQATVSWTAKLELTRADSFSLEHAVRGRTGADHSVAKHSGSAASSMLSMMNLFKTPKKGERMDFSKIEAALMQMAQHSVPESTQVLLQSILNITDQQMKASITQQVAISRAKILNATEYLNNCSATADNGFNEVRWLEGQLPGLMSDFHTCVNGLSINISANNVDYQYVFGPNGNYKGGQANADNTPQCVLDAMQTTSTTDVPASASTGQGDGGAQPGQGAVGTQPPITITGTGCCDGVYVYDPATGTWTTNPAVTGSCPSSGCTSGAGGSWNELSYNGATGTWTIVTVTSSGSNSTTSTVQFTSSVDSFGSVTGVGQLTWVNATGNSVSLGLEQAPSSVEDLPATISITNYNDENVVGTYVIQPMTTGPATVGGSLYYAAVWKKLSNGAVLKWDPADTKWILECSACGLASGCATLLTSVATSEVSPIGVTTWYMGNTIVTPTITMLGNVKAKDALQALKLSGTAAIDGIAYVAGIYMRTTGQRLWEKAGNPSLRFCGTSWTSKWHVIDTVRSAELLYTASTLWVNMPQDAPIWGPHYSQGSAATVTQASMAEILDAIAQFLGGSCSNCADGSQDRALIETLPTDCGANTTISSNGGILSGGTSTPSDFPPAQLALQNAGTANAFLNGRYTRDPADSDAATGTEKWKRCAGGGPEIIYTSQSLKWTIQLSGIVLYQWTAGADKQVPSLSHVWTGLGATQEPDMRVTEAVCVGSCSSTEQCMFTGDRYHQDCINAVAACDAFERFDSLDGDNTVGGVATINLNDPTGVNPATQKCLLGALVGSKVHSDISGECGFWEDLNIGDLPGFPGEPCDGGISQRGPDPARPDQNRPLTYIDLNGGVYFSQMKDYWEGKLADWDAKWAACQTARAACSAHSGTPSGPFPVDASFSDLSNWNATAPGQLTCPTTTTSTTQVWPSPSPMPAPMPSPMPTSPMPAPTPMPMTTSPMPTPTPTPMTTSPTPAPTPMPMTTSPMPAPTPMPMTTSPMPAPTPVPTPMPASTTQTTTQAPPDACRVKQDLMDEAACSQGRLQVKTCKDYDCCYDYVNMSLYAEWEPICRSDASGILFNLQEQYYGVLRIECLINALGKPDSERAAAVDACAAKDRTSYAAQLPDIQECTNLSFWPQHRDYSECKEASTQDPTIDQDVSGTDAYRVKYYYPLVSQSRYYQTCTSQCCYQLPDPPAPACPDACACGKSVSPLLLEEGAHLAAATV